MGSEMCIRDSWGVASFDFDNDGDRDLAIGNGHISGRSSRDYCSTFWRHDLYTDPDALPWIMRDVYGVTQKGLGKECSWNGFEHNCLLMNVRYEGARKFQNVAFLFGLASEADTRNVIECDIDRDGRVDLLTVETSSGKSATLKVYHNQLPQTSNWLGVRFDKSLQSDALGARVTLEGAGRTYVQDILVGDSFNSQREPVAHFGLGEDRPQRIRIEWSDGSVSHRLLPECGTYHVIRAK